MDSIASADVLAVLTPIWHELPETAKRVRQRIGTVMDWAVAQGYRQDNPAAARSGEVRGATWNEIDAATWTVPASRMKAGREHRVPLSQRALAVLAEASAFRTGEDGLVFPAQRGNPLSDSTISKLCRENGINAVPHGFRSSFRDWASEKTNAPHAVMEAALAHTISNQVEAAYHRTDLFDRRRKLMDSWADYLAATPTKVVKIG